MTVEISCTCYYCDDGVNPDVVKTMCESCFDECQNDYGILLDKYNKILKFVKQRIGFNNDYLSLQCKILLQELKEAE